MEGTQWYLVAGAAIASIAVAVTAPRSGHIHHRDPPTMTLASKQAAS